MPDGGTIDDVFRALADPTRRQVLERLSRSPASVSELAAPFDMALPSFVQHLRLLEDCGLVSSRKEGRVRTYRIEAKPMKAAESWLARQRFLDLPSLLPADAVDRMRMIAEVAP